MKKLILLFTIIFVVQNAKGQIGTDLQFSQTLLKCQPDSVSSINIGIVPAGKIWKVVGTTSLEYSNPSTAMYYGYMRLQIINTGQIVMLQRMFTPVYYSDKLPVIINANFPIYFNENTELEFKTYGGSLGGCVSIVEYTVIPWGKLFT